MMRKETEFSEWLRKKITEIQAKLRLRSDADFARYAGVSKASLSRWLNGEKEPDYHSVGLLAQALGLKPRKIFEAMGYIETTSPTDCDEDELSWLDIWRSTPTFPEGRRYLRMTAESARQMVEKLAIYETDKEEE